MDEIVDGFYHVLDRLGYLHPIHPAMTHMPIGLVVGAFFLGWFAKLYKSGSNSAKLLPSAYYAFVVAYIFYFPTVLFGVMDWQRYLAGAWLFAIKMKLFLASVLFVLLTVGVVAGYKAKTKAAVMLTIYTLVFINVTVLGYYGGQLVYAGQTPEAPAQYRAGAKVFDSNCSGCHAHGGNIINPNLPLRSAPQLDQASHFIHFIRSTILPDGSKGAMPPFLSSRISDQQANDLYEYVFHVIAQPKR
ncbi:MAG: c-type cytochrome [Gammaproteobacteria bacterium]